MHPRDNFFEKKNEWIAFFRVWLLGLRFMRPSEVKDRNPKNRILKNATHANSMIDSLAPLN